MAEEYSDIVSLRYADVGTALPSIGAAPVTWPSSPGTAANEVQSVTLTGTPEGGDFTLSYGGVESGDIAYDATASEVEEALESMSSIGEGNVDVSGNAGGPWSVTFQRDLGYRPIATMTADGSGLTGGTNPDVAVAEVTPGLTGGGIWTAVPTVDVEKGVKLGWDSTIRNIRTAGTARPVRQHLLSLALASIEFQTTESGMTALRFMFPSLTYDAGTRKLTLRQKSVEASYVALALETPAGVFEIKKCAPRQDSELNMLISDITQPTVVLETYENASGEVAFFHAFE